MIPLAKYSKFLIKYLNIIWRKKDKKKKKCRSNLQFQYQFHKLKIRVNLIKQKRTNWKNLSKKEPHFWTKANKWKKSKQINKKPNQDVPIVGYQRMFPWLLCALFRKLMLSPPNIWKLIGSIIQLQLAGILCTLIATNSSPEKMSHQTCAIFVKETPMYSFLWQPSRSKDGIQKFSSRKLQKNSKPLLIPRKIKFKAKDWNFLGYKLSLNQYLSPFYLEWWMTLNFMRTILLKFTIAC